MLNTRLMEKLRKIQILAERSEGAEAEEAARQLQRLLTREGLTAADIAPLDNEGSPKPSFTRIKIEGVPNIGWERSLLVGLAAANHGTTVGVSVRGRYGVKGTKAVDLIVPKNIAGEVVQLFHYWKAEVEYLAKKHRTEAKTDLANTSYHWWPKIYMSSYREGLVNGIVSVIKEAAKTETEKMVADAVITSALVLDLKEQRDIFVLEAYHGNLTIPQSKRRSIGFAHSQGVATGREQSSAMHGRLSK